MAHSPMSWPARGGTVLVACGPHWCVFGVADPRELPAAPNGFAAAQECAFGQVHTCHVVAVPADATLPAPGVVVAAGAGERFVAAGALRR